MSDELDVIGRGERGGIVLTRPDCVDATDQFVMRSRWTTNVHHSATRVTYHISVNPELDADEVSVKPHGGDVETFRVAGGAEAVPAEHDDASPAVTVPIEIDRGIGGEAA